MLTDCCYIGIEAEGPDQGVKTLFIADKNADPVRLTNLLRKHADVSYVYFGAGKNYGVGDKHLPFLRILLDSGYKVIVETDAFIRLINLVKFLKRVKPANLTIVYVVPTHDLHHIQFADVRVKFEDEYDAVVLSGSTMTQNSLTSHLYDTDQKVDL